MKPVLALTAIALAIAACGPQASSDASTKDKPAAGAASASWNALDACGLVSAADVGAAAGVTVSGTKLDAHPGEGGLASFSTCTYALSNGGTITLLARRSPSADATPEAIEAARTMGGNAPAATAVPGLGKAAWWTPEMKSLQVFIDDTRYVTLGAFQGVADPRTALTAIARKTF